MVGLGVPGRVQYTKFPWIQSLLDDGSLAPLEFHRPGLAVELSIAFQFLWILVPRGQNGGEWERFCCKTVFFVEAKPCFLKHGEDSCGEQTNILEKHPCVLAWDFFGGTRKRMRTSFFQVTFWWPKWRSLKPWKGHLKHPKKVTGKNLVII